MVLLPQIWWFKIEDREGTPRLRQELRQEGALIVSGRHSAARHMAAAGSALAAVRAGPVEKQLTDALKRIKELEKLVAERDATILAMQERRMRS